MNINNIGWDEKNYIELFRRFVGHNSKYNDNVYLLDIGANQGEFTEYFLDQMPDVKAFLFEPVPEIFSKLHDKFEFNKNVVCTNAGLSDTNNFDGMIYYVTSAEGMNNPSGLSSMFYRNNYFPKWITRSERVELFKLDDVWDFNQSINYVKIDVEGGEYQVLKGAEKFFKYIHPEFIQWEYGECYQDAGHTGKQVLEILESYGYKTLNRNLQPEMSMLFTEKFWDVQNFLSVSDVVGL